MGGFAQGPGKDAAGYGQPSSKAWEEWKEEHEGYEYADTVVEDDEYEEEY